MTSERDPEGAVWRKLAAALLAGSILFVAPACEANVETDDGIEEDDEDSDADLDDDDVEDEEIDEEEDDDVDIEIDEED